MPGFATSRPHQEQRLEADGRARRHRATRSTSARSAEQMLARPRPPVRRAARRSTTSPSRTSRPASAPRTCSAWPTTTAGSSIGTGDLSELALGWATYGVGDQMSHYAVNASVPEDADQLPAPLGHRHRPVRRRRQRRAAVRSLDTEISPELDPRRRRPADRRHREQGRPVRAAGLLPVLHRCASATAPSKVAFLAEHAWGDRERGVWPDLIPDERRNEYALAEIKHWLGVFLRPLLPPQPVQAHGDPERARRSARAARSRRAATGARPATHSAAVVAGRAAPQRAVAVQPRSAV